MDPTTTFCPNWTCPARGQTGQGNLDIHVWQRNLTGSEMRRVVRALAMAHTVSWDYAPARMDLIRQWEPRGAKKGDAVITAHLEVATIRYLVSEHRDYLMELVVDHPGWTFLIDREGMVRYRYLGSLLEVETMLEDMRTLW